MLVGTLLGGPLVAGIMGGINLNILGLKSKAHISFILGVAGNLLIYAFVLLLPEKILDKFPHFFIPLIYTTITYIFIEYLHHDQLFTSFTDGAGKKPFYKSLLWGFLGLLITMIIIITNLNLKYFQYNSLEFGNSENELYYSKGIPQEEAIIIIDYLKQDTYFNGDTSRMLYLTENGSKYKLLILMDETNLFKPEVNMDFRLLESIINRSDINRTIEIFLGDEYQETEYRIN